MGILDIHPFSDRQKANYCPEMKERGTTSYRTVPSGVNYILLLLFYFSKTVTIHIKYIGIVEQKNSTRIELSCQSPFTVDPPVYLKKIS